MALEGRVTTNVVTVEVVVMMYLLMAVVFEAIKYIAICGRKILLTTLLIHSVLTFFNRLPHHLQSDAFSSQLVIYCRFVSGLTRLNMMR